jgi:hypothetical protein
MKTSASASVWCRVWCCVWCWLVAVIDLTSSTTNLTSPGGAGLARVRRRSACGRRRRRR